MDSVEHKKIQISRDLDNLAYILDGTFRVPLVGWRFGFDFILGLIPTVGDFATTLVSFYILVSGVRYGVPKITLVRMAMNIVIDYLLGLLPVVGDILDLFWRSNEKNIALIKARATSEGVGKTSDYLFVGGMVVILLTILLGTISFSVWLIYSLFNFIIGLFN